VSSAQEDAPMARIVKCARIVSEAVSAIAKRHAEARPRRQSAVPIFLRFDKTPDCVDLICKVREYLALAQIGQLTETFMLHGATEVKELLLQLWLLPCPTDTWSLCRAFCRLAHALPRKYASRSEGESDAPSS